MPFSDLLAETLGAVPGYVNEVVLLEAGLVESLAFENLYCNRL